MIILNNDIQHNRLNSSKEHSPITFSYQMCANRKRGDGVKSHRHPLLFSEFTLCIHQFQGIYVELKVQDYPSLVTGSV